MVIELPPDAAVGRHDTLSRAVRWVADAAGRCVAVDPEWQELTGRANEDALGVGWLALIHPDDRRRVEQTMRDAHGTREPFSLDYRLGTPELGYRWVHGTGEPRFDSDGTFAGFTGAVRALSIPADPALAIASDNHFRVLADNMPQLAWMANVRGWIFWYNRRWFEYTGTTLDQMQGWGWTAVHHPDHADRVVASFQHSIDTGEPWEDLFPLRSAGGTYRWFLSRAMPIRDAAGEIVRWFGTNTDVTAQREAEDALRRSETEFRNLADAMPQLVWIASATGEVEYYNGRAHEYGGLATGDDGNWTWQPIVHPDEREATEAAWSHAAATGSPYEMEHRLLRANGEYRWHVSRATTVRDADGQVTRWYGTATDIDDLKRAEAALREQQAQLVEALAVKEEFLGLVSHELRTPLTAILGMGRMLVNSGLNPALASEAAREILINAERLNSLIDNMLVLARLDKEGSGQPALEPLLLHHISREAAEKHRQRFPMRRVNVRVDVPSPLVDGQPAWLAQVIDNFLGNAEKYSPQGVPIDIVIDAGGGSVRLAVLDRGMGFAPGDEEQLFNSFYRSPAAMARASGAGLGLAVCRRLVLLQGGEIGARPREGGGAEFYFTLPSGPNEA
ncbi:MAG: PAS domain-containing sensor histidine kinase [Dehalococcoidia bacterium]|nr:PAS domain-containing sensor histidine kinase [Dehalococcoidia bacterium]